MFATAKNTFSFQTTAIGSLPTLNQQEWFHSLDQVDIPFYPEFPNDAGHMMLDYPIGKAHQERQVIFDKFCYYLRFNNKIECKLQWCGLFTFTQYRSEIDQYLNYFSTLLNWIEELKYNVPTIQKIYIFLDEPALANALQDKVSLDHLEQYNKLLQKLAGDIYVHCCGQLPANWPQIYAGFGLSFDVFFNQMPDNYFHQFFKLALGVSSQHSNQISSSILARTQLITPPCGLTSYSKSQVIEILSKLRGF